MEYHCPVDVVAISESPLVKATLSRRCRYQKSQNVLQQRIYITRISKVNTFYYMPKSSLYKVKCSVKYNIDITLCSE